MSRSFCYICESAGSVNRWGSCEICGEEYGNKLKSRQLKDFHYEEAAPSGSATDEYAIYGIGTKETAVSLNLDAA